MTRRNRALLAILFLSQILAARGAYENEQEYFNLIEEHFPRIIQDIDDKVITPQEGKAILQSLREQYGRQYRDSDGIMESLIDQLWETRISIDDALHQFSLLQEKQLMSYRRDQNRREIRESSERSDSSESSDFPENSETNSDSNNRGGDTQSDPEKGDKNQKGDGGNQQNRNGR